MKVYLLIMSEGLPMKSHNLNMSQTRATTTDMLTWIGKDQEASTLHKEWLKNMESGRNSHPQGEAH